MRALPWAASCGEDLLPHPPCACTRDRVGQVFIGSGNLSILQVPFMCAHEGDMYSLLFLMDIKATYLSTRPSALSVAVTIVPRCSAQSYLASEQGSSIFVIAYVLLMSNWASCCHNSCHTPSWLQVPSHAQVLARCWMKSCHRSCPKG